METDTITLEEIHTALAEVGSLMTAIDHGEGDQVYHWQMIGLLDHRLRRLTRTLPDDLFCQMPNLAVFALSTDTISSSWRKCQDEVRVFLESSH
jgi:hypothetical protein